MNGSFDIYYEQITGVCLERYRGSAPIEPLRLAQELMALDGFPIHAPLHHYLVPAVLLTACRKAQQHPAEVLERDLALALERSQNVPGGACGFYGSCGACVGVGISWSVITDTTPLSGQSWAYGNRATGQALLAVAEVGGPRCCKRSTFLSLSSALPQIRSVLGIELAEETPPCTFHSQNTECLGKACPYYPGTPIPLPTFCFPKKDPEHPCPCQDRPVELTHKQGLLFWRKAVGEPVAEGEVIAELEVEKKSLEILSPASGTLLRQCFADGETIGGSAVIGYLEEA